MSISGNLKTMQFAELLQWLAQGKKTGTLRIDNGRIEKRIFFREGVIISSASTDPNEHLGHFLVSHGYITEAQLAEGMREQEKSKVLLGKILAGMGLISEADLDRMLHLKTEESLYDLFNWHEAEFRVIEEPPPQNMVPIAIEVTGLVMEAVQRQDEWKRIRERIHSSHAIPILVGKLGTDNLEPGEQQVLAEVNDEHNVEEICLHTHASEFFVCRVLFDQVEKKKLKIANPKSAPKAAVGDAAISPDGLLRTAKRHLDEEDYEQAMRHYRAARSLDPEDKTILAVLQQAEERVRKEVEKAGAILTAVPVLARRLDELTTLAISPQEGFILSRINGNYDIQSILKISPMPTLDAQIVVWKLLRAGHITLKAKRSAPPASGT